MVFPLQWAYPDGPDQPPPRTPTAFGSPPWPVRAERREDRWVVLPQEAFTLTETSRSLDDGGWLVGGDASLPAAATYAAETGSFRLELRYQTVHVLDNAIQSQTGLSLAPGRLRLRHRRPMPALPGPTRPYSFTAVFTGKRGPAGRLGRVAMPPSPLPTASHPALKIRRGKAAAAPGPSGATAPTAAPAPGTVRSPTAAGLIWAATPTTRRYGPAGYLVELTPGGPPGRPPAPCRRRLQR